MVIFKVYNWLFLKFYHQSFRVCLLLTRNCEIYMHEVYKWNPCPRCKFVAIICVLFCPWLYTFVCQILCSNKDATFQSLGSSVCFTVLEVSRLWKFKSRSSVLWRHDVRKDTNTSADIQPEQGGWRQQPSSKRRYSTATLQRRRPRLQLG
jgi:hypothetical protein